MADRRPEITSARSTKTAGSPPGISRWAIRLALVLLCVSSINCKSTVPCDQRCQVEAQLSQRMGQSLGPRTCPDEVSIPPDVDLSDGISEDEAVAIALWNNAAYRELMSQLGISRAQLLDAGLLTDPEMTIFFPVGPKQLEFAFFQSISAMWLRPIRIRAAELDLCRVSDQMVQNGLNLIRDVRLAHAQLVLAQASADFSQETLRLQTEIAELAQKRLNAGDISELESMNTQIDAVQAKADLARSDRDVELAREQLRVMLGLGQFQDPLVAVAPIMNESAPDDVESLLAEALAMRPDLRAAELNVQAALERSELAEWQFMNLDAIYDANGQGRQGFESGPGLRLTIPIFNGNKGGIAIADAQLDQALRQYITVRDQITLDVKNAHTQLLQAQENLRVLREEMLPTLESSVGLAQKSFVDGGSDYFIVLITTGRYITTQNRELQLRADVQRALAELDRSVGHRVSTRLTDVMLPESYDETLPAPAPEPAPALPELVPVPEQANEVSRRSEIALAEPVAPKMNSTEPVRIKSTVAEPVTVQLAPEQDGAVSLQKIEYSTNSTTNIPAETGNSLDDALLYE